MSVHILSMYIILLLQAYDTRSQVAYAPVNPELIKYLENKKHSLQAGEADMCGIIPASALPHFHNRTSNTKNKNTGLPVKYDLREEGYVTPVRTQGNCGACWMFTTMAAIESNWLKNGYGEYDLSEQHLKNCHGFVRGGCEGGNHLFATAYLTGWSGPVNETDDPYNVQDDTCDSSLTPAFYVPEARFLPGDADIIKQAIVDYGGLYTTMYFSTGYFHNQGKTYFYTGDEAVNHGVMLAGWDDEKSTPGGTGAWICKNSYGSGWGENGYFYISYQDSKILSSNAFYPERIENVNNIIVQQYDELGWVTNVGYNDEIAFALTRFTAGYNQKLTGVGTYAVGENTTLDISVYYGKDGDEPVHLLGACEKYTCAMPGFYWIELPFPIKINCGESYYIRIKYKTPDYEYPIPLEGYLDDYADPVIESGVCWISNGGLEWEPVGKGSGMENDICIKTLSVIDTVQNITASGSITLFPNPFNRYLNIDFQGLSGNNIAITLVNEAGQDAFIREYGSTDIKYIEHLDLAALRKGVYFVKLTGDAEDIEINTKRLVKL
ncbi:MAG: T9SS type A sorting domain-containing protein [Bacteroidetes bacterium]|nr:T9SS type A sorting domain-containing protein [Bacteroidota bacterium]